MDIDSLLTMPESKTLEFKRDLSATKGILRTLVAFANTAGGTLLVGVDDDRSVRGVEDALEQEERLSNLVCDGIEPRLMPDIEVVSWRRNQLLAVRVHPSAIRPHFVRAEGMPGGVYVRVGSTNRIADCALLDAMRRYAAGESFDATPLPELDSEALDFRAASEFMGRKVDLHAKDGATLQILARAQGRMVPTVGGVLLFGRNVQASFPDAWMQCGRFAGTTKAVIADHHDVRGTLPVLLEGALAFVRKHATVGVEITGLRRTNRWNVPMQAVREALVNAVVHADYALRGRPMRLAVFDDRIEIENPGILTLGMTMEDLLQGVSVLRNRVIGRVFREAGLIEQWGSGVQRMIADCLAHGLPRPRFEELGFGFRVTLGLLPERAPEHEKDPVEARILSMLDRSPEGVGTDGIAAEIGISTRAVRARMASLVRRGLVAVIGTGPRDPRRCFKLVPNSLRLASYGAKRKVEGSGHPQHDE